MLESTSSVSPAHYFTALDPGAGVVALVRALPDAALLETADGRLTAVNAPLEHLFLLDGPPASWQGQPTGALLDRMAPLLAEPAQLRTLSRARAGRPQQATDQLLAMADGRVLRGVVTPIAPEAGLAGWLWQFADVTATQRAAEATRQAAALAQRTRSMRQAFITAMSHELRTPMNAVVGLAHLLGETDLAEEQREILDGLQRSADHLLNDVLDFSRLETGGVAFATDPLDLRALVADLAAPYTDAAQAQGLQLETQVASDVPPAVLGDEARLRQILGNLLDNALAFTHKGSVRLAVACERQQGGRAFLRFDVADTGIGIDPPQQARLFDPSHQVTAAAQVGGTGLGLAIVRQIVKQQGGSVRLASEVGEGSTFSVRLSFPVGSASDYRPGSAPGEQLLDEKLPPDELSGARVLVVDDHPLNRLLVERMLTQWGMEATCAEDGAQAVELMRSTTAPFDLVLMDLQMPALDGFEATRAIRALPEPAASVPVLALTAAGGGERDAVFTAGMDDCVRKPFKPAHLLRRLRAHLSTARRMSSPSAASSFPSGTPSVNTEPALANLPTPDDAVAALDLDLLEVHAMGDPDFVRHLLDTFVTQTGRVVTEVQAAFAAGDWAQVRLLTHKVRPSLRMVGLGRVEALAHALDEEAAALASGAAARPAGDFAERLEAMVAACRAVCAHLAAGD